MKLRISMFVLLFALFTGIPYSGKVFNSQYNFYRFEENLQEKSIFVENGVKVQYRTDNSVSDERQKIKKLFNDYACEEKITDELEEIYLLKDKENINVKLWSYNKKSYVEIILINNNKDYTTDELCEKLNKINDKKIKDMEYFLYYKGKVDKNISDDIANENNIDNLELININNGFTGVGYLKDNQKINFAEIQYDTGLYIIIATPIIFTTY